jgi:hypothetical protein
LKIVVGREIPLLALDGFWSGLRGYLNENCVCVCVCLGQETDKKSIGLEIFCIKYMASSKSSVWRKNSANHKNFSQLQAQKFIQAYSAFLKRQGKLPIPGSFVGFSPSILSETRRLRALAE